MHSLFLLLLISPPTDASAIDVEDRGHWLSHAGTDSFSLSTLAKNGDGLQHGVDTEPVTISQLVAVLLLLLLLLLSKLLSPELLVESLPLVHELAPAPAAATPSSSPPSRMLHGSTEVLTCGACA
jgi:hypothetical protein